MDEAQIDRLIARGALFAVNHSGGKDSQCMFQVVRERVPERQIICVHAELPDVEWDGIIPHIEATIGDVPLIVTRAKKTFLEMVERRGMFPSPAQRQCTSDLKRDPINKEIRRFLAAHPAFGNVVVSCIGLRAEESSSRARRAVLSLSQRNSVAGREWYEWLPIHGFSTEKVFETIRAAGQEPHPIYKRGLSRLSCAFCIYANAEQLKIAARLKPDLYRRYAALERKIGRSMLMPKPGQSAFLEDVTGIRID